MFVFATRLHESPLRSGPFAFGIMAVSRPLFNARFSMACFVVACGFCFFFFPAPRPVRRGWRVVCRWPRLVAFAHGLRTIMNTVTVDWRETFCRIVRDYPVWTLMDPAVASRTPDELGPSHMRAWWLITAFGGRFARSVYAAMTSYCQVGSAGL